MKNPLNNKKINFLEGEYPLLEIDKEIKYYAERNQMKLTKNYHDWPERSLLWKNEKVSRQIQIYLDGKNSNKFLVWGCAYKDRLLHRYWWKKEPIIFGIPLNWDKIKTLFDELKEILNNIRESDLIET